MQLYIPFCLFLFLAVSACVPTPKPSNDSPAVTAEIVTPPAEQEMEKHQNKPATSPGQQMPEPEPEKKPQEDREQTAPAIQQIRAEYTRITQLFEAEELREIKLQFECENDPGGGSLLRYYEDGKLVMMQMEQGSDHGWDNKTIYLKDGNPFFVFEKEGYWTFGGPEIENGANTIDNFIENRYYIESGIVIRHLYKAYVFKTWEENLEPDQIPNQSMPIESEQEYHGMPAISQMITGDVGC